MTLLDRLRRHPFGVEAFFRWSLVVTYAVPSRALRSWLPQGLALDTYDDFGFLAIALVATENLRPAGLPRSFGQSFFLSGTRIFARFERPGKPPLRGLRILRSDTDRRAMVWLGNLFTHYGYRLARVAASRSRASLEVEVRTPDREADFRVVADLTAGAGLPVTSPFRSLGDARRFAGPLPYTFDVDRPTGRILAVRALHRAWSPRLVRVVSEHSSFLERANFGKERPRIASAFFVEEVPYAWNPGTLEGGA